MLQAQISRRRLLQAVSAGVMGHGLPQLLAMEATTTPTGLPSQAKQVLVVHGEDGLCELTMSGATFVAELRDGEIREYTITPEELGLERGDLDAIRITEAEESAATIRGILSGTEQGPDRTIALMNTAGALLVSGVTDDLKAGVTLATEAVDSGKAQAKLNALVEFTQQAA